MRHKQQSLGKVIRTAAVAGGFGGALWFLMLLIFVPAQERYSREWWLVGLGATLFWSAVGVIVAAFGAGGAIHGPPPVTGNPPRGRSWALVLFLATGSFLY